MPFFTTNDGVKINYHDYGVSPAQAVVFVNGYSASEITWLLQTEVFAKAGYHVVTYDQRNHGASDKVAYGLTIQRLGLDLAQLIAHLQLTKVILIGHSMGASTINAYEELMTADNLAAVVTEDQSPTFLKFSDWLNGAGKDLSELTDFMAGFAQTHLTKKPLPDEIKRTLGRGMLPFDFKANSGLFRNVVTQDWRANLARETVPHLFLAGGASPIFPPEHAQAARELQKNESSQALVFEGCGHILHLEEAEKFNETVLDFLGKVVEA
jgi:pimeloyl-ACP methyl ester carboxylesterase